MKERVILCIGHVPDEKVEVYSKAAEVLTIPYVHIFQSGVQFLAYSFGLPVLATGLVKYFTSDLLLMFLNLSVSRKEVRKFANEKHSWMKVGAITKLVHCKLLDEHK